MDLSFDEHRAFADARRFSFPRRSGSPGEARILSILETSLAEIGLTVERETFDFSSLRAEAIRRFVPILSALLFSAAALVLWRPVRGSAAPEAASSLSRLGRLLARVPESWGALLLVCGVLVLAWAFWCVLDGRRLFPRGARRGVNLVARYPGTAGDSATPRLVLVAHHDSKSQRLSFAGRASASLLYAVGTAGLLCVLVERIRERAFAPAAGGASFPSILPAGIDRSALLVAMLASLAGGFLLLINATANRSEGALDNASGLAVLLEVARAAASAPGATGEALRNELILVATGAEEEGMVGAFRLAERSARGSLGRGSVSFVNLDGTGAEGRLFALRHRPSRRRAAHLVRRPDPRDTDADLLDAALGAAEAELRSPIVRLSFLPGGVDGVAFARAGYPAITLLSGSPVRSLRRVHRPGDTIEHVSPAALGRCGRLVLRVALGLTSGRRER